MDFPKGTVFKDEIDESLKKAKDEIANLASNGLQLEEIQDLKNQITTVKKYIARQTFFHVIKIVVGIILTAMVIIKSNDAD